jgi:hypothetical protein
MFTITPLTELEAVNEIISSVGEAPVSTLENATSVDVVNAVRMLRVVNRDIQSMGWTFNRADNVTLVPDRYEKQIPWDDTILYIQTYDGSVLRNRGGVVFNVTDNTDVFDEPITVKVRYLVPFEELPEPFRNYITARTARIFQQRYLTDDSLEQGLAQAEAGAWALVMEYEHDMERNNLTMNQAIMTLMQR